MDPLTTYGTLLYWPFSDVRVAWNAIAIVDPLFTLVVLAGVALAAWQRRAAPAASALAVCFAYLLPAGHHRVTSSLIFFVGGERGIRTPGTLSGSTVFKTAAFNHSAISPRNPEPGTQAYCRAIFSNPSMYGLNAVGITTDPSSCW